MRANRLAILPLGLSIFLVVLLSFFVSAQVQDSSLALAGPSCAHWFGNDSLGRDLFARVLEGARLSVAIGFFSAIVALALGLIYGACAAFSSPRVDAFLMRAADLFYSLPTFLLAALLLLLLGRGPGAVILALGLTSWVGEARLVRVLVKQAKGMAYVEGARALGLASVAIFRKHILPNMMGPVLVSIASAVPAIILSESVLSFVGLGLEAPYASLGTLAQEGWRAFRAYPHLIFPPGIMLFLIVCFFSTLGDEARDSLDPRRRAR